MTIEAKDTNGGADFTTWRYRRRGQNFVFPLLLIVCGGLLLLGNLGLLTVSFWESVGRLWPLILVLLGVGAIFRDRVRIGLGSAILGFLVIAILVVAVGSALGLSLTPLTAPGHWGLPGYHISWPQ